MNSENSSEENKGSEISWIALLAVYFVMVVIVTMIRGVPTLGGGASGLMHVMLSYVAEAFAPVLVAMILTGVYHGIRLGKSSWKRNTAVVSIIVFGFYLIGVLGRS